VATKRSSSNRSLLVCPIGSESFIAPPSLLTNFLLATEDSIGITWIHSRLDHLGVDGTFKTAPRPEVNARTDCLRLDLTPGSLSREP